MRKFFKVLFLASATILLTGYLIPERKSMSCCTPADYNPNTFWYADVVERPSWIPVEERLPEKNTWVLAYCKYKDHVIDYVDIHGLWSYGNVTHWMPPPEPPKEEA